MGRKFKLIAGGGCAVLVLVVVALLGSATWYAAKFSKEYKKVVATETALVEATVDFDNWGPPPEGTSSDRLDAFLNVREALVTERAILKKANGDFRNEEQGWWSRLSGGADLVPIYAVFWQARNEALLEQGVGPMEYIFTYRLAYYGFLGHDPMAGIDMGEFDPGQASWLSPWVDDIPGATGELLESQRGRIEATWDEEVNPLELIFDGLKK